MSTKTQPYPPVEASSSPERIRRMRRVLIVSPQFVPVNAADMQRVRMSLPFYAEFGWEPLVLSVKQKYVEGVTDEMLNGTLPPGVPVFRTDALPARWTRKAGLGNLALRAFPFLYREGCRVIRERDIDLVYFSTTIFPAMALGRLWKRRFGVPFVVDMQDPWLSEYHEGRPRKELPPKYWFSGRLDRVLEPWTMKEADGLIAVSQAYIDTLARRYPRLAGKPSAVIPFGAAESDFEVVRRNPRVNRFFEPGDPAKIHGVYVGRGGRDMAPALRILFAALRRGLERSPELFSKIQLHFVGTDYAPEGQAKETIAPLAREAGAGDYVHETPGRIPYFEALQLLLDADFLIVPGSDDPQYTASKIFPYILARKPLLGLFQESSSVCDILRRTRAGTLLTFQPEVPADRYAEQFHDLWRDLLARLPFMPETDREAFAPFSARNSAAAQCRVFDRVAAQRVGAERRS